LAKTCRRTKQTSRRRSFHNPKQSRSSHCTSPEGRPGHAREIADPAQ
jgi:hypothetical protein